SLPSVTSLPAGAGAGADPEPLVIAVESLFGTGDPQAVSIVRSSIVAAADADLPVVGNRTFLAAVAAEPGDEVVVQIGATARHLRIVDVAEAFPTTDPDQPIAIVDLASLSLARFAGNHAYQNVDEWWLHLAHPAAALPHTAALGARALL